MRVVGAPAILWDFGFPELEAILSGAALFSAGVLIGPMLPVWRCWKDGEKARFEAVMATSPAMPWIRLARRVGIVGSAAVFLAVCAAISAAYLWSNA